MKVTPLPLPGALLLDMPVHEDPRGSFVERHNRNVSRATGLAVFVQDNFSRSRPGVLRGLHFDRTFRQGKLVGVTRGAIFDVMVDLRPKSPTFGKFHAERLEGVGRLVWVPPGMAHGFCVVGGEEADVTYKVTTLYDPGVEEGIFWADPELAIPWPVQDPILSQRDRALPSFDHIRQWLLKE